MRPAGHLLQTHSERGLVPTDYEAPDCMAITLNASCCSHHLSPVDGHCAGRTLMPTVDQGLVCL